MLALAAADTVSAFPAGPETAGGGLARTKNTRLVAHVPLEGGFNGDVWFHRDTVYVGGWGRTAAHCPVRGVRAVDVHDPTAPRVLARFARFAGTTSEDVWVGELSTRYFSGDLAAVGIQLCDTSFEGMAKPTFRGLALFDVTNPVRPVLLSRLSSGSRTHGVHELAGVTRVDGRTLVLESVPRAYENSDGAVGDVRIIDVTDPTRPVELADWDVRRNAPARTRAAVNSSRPEEDLLVHSAWPFDRGKKMFVSHWDAGVVFLDISRPSRPRYLSRMPYRARDEGNAHSGWLSEDETLFVQNDEVYRPSRTFPRPSRQKAWGYQRIFDVSDPSRPQLLGTFATENAVAGADGRIPEDGYFSVHNNIVVGGIEYASWYSDGVRIVDLADPMHPREIGFFVPPPQRDPQRFIVAPDGTRRLTMVWGVAVGDDPGIVYASDINSGLWIFRVLE